MNSEHRVQNCDKEIDYKAVKKRWDSWVSKNLANLQGNFRNKSFLDFYARRLQWFLFEKKLDQYNRR